ncbi:hypothetical protein QR98_0055410 [Sarcoptes scabiei]|uniref:Uncharacterized protein n=1 Tax=Sarcoptes scabiei TaxID=52283 RepID=A0A132A858_SARSC|nr:hypothetical protein QR98_0055410 [Sarcoptes scabiei]
MHFEIAFGCESITANITLEWPFPELAIIIDRIIDSIRSLFAGDDVDAACSNGLNVSKNVLTSGIVPSGIGGGKIGPFDCGIGDSEAARGHCWPRGLLASKNGDEFLRFIAINLLKFNSSVNIDDDGWSGYRFENAN